VPSVLGALVVCPVVFDDNETPGSVGPVDLGAKVATKASSEVSLKAKPRRDRAKPFKFRVSGDLGGFIPDSATCAETVDIRAKRGSKGTGRAKGTYNSAGAVASTGPG
jgi:hypothetical protein